MTATSNDQTAFLVVGHGTRKPAGAEQLKRLVQTMRCLAPNRMILESFLELAEPSIADALEQGAIQGVRRILVVPVLLFSAGHAKADIPDAVAEHAQRLGIEVLGQTPSLGTAEAVLRLSDQRFHEVALDAREAGCPPGHCGKVRCEEGMCALKDQRLGEIALAMVGRGTSDVIALEHMRELTRLSAARKSLVWHATGFFAGGKPNVQELLEEASQIRCDTVVVQPHLLFEGELMDQLRRFVVEYQDRYPDRRWIMARCLGADIALAKLFLDWAQAKLAELP